MKKSELYNAHDYLDKHTWHDMDTNGLKLVCARLGHAFSDDAIALFGLRLCACKCGAAKMVDRDKREFRVN